MARSCRLALLAAAGAVGVAARGTTRAALRGAGAGGGNSTAGPNATLPKSTARVGFAPGYSPCDCVNGCSDGHCSDVIDVFEMIRWDRDGSGTGGALLHMIGSPEDVDDMLGDDGRINWLSDMSFDKAYHVINDCQADASQPSCSAAAVLRSDILPIVFNYPSDPSSGSGSGKMHPIGLLFDPWQLKDAYSIKAMFVLDGDTVDHPWQSDHPACRLASGWDWPSDYDAAEGSFDTNDVYTAMEKQCYFSLEQDQNWAGFWGNFIDARKAALRAIRDGSFGEPDSASYLEPEINIEISDDVAWDSMYKHALKAVVVQTNYCSEQLGSTDAVNKYCTDDTDAEDSVIQLAKLGACRVALQIKEDTGNFLPVIEANLLTNSMYNEDAWEQFRSGEDYLANPEDYLQYYDCCWLLNDGSLYDQLQDAGWYAGQCCWEQDGGGGWKNCDYCTNCNSPEN